jgi:membrane-associated protease RseP (regulator of RpoE activity)
MHFLQAFVLFVVAFSWLGIPAYTDTAERLGADVDETSWHIEEVTPDSAADAAGILPGDRIVSIDGDPVGPFSDVGPLIEDRVGDTLPIVVERGDRTVALTATIGHQPGEPDDALLGVRRDDLPDLPPVTGSPVRSAIVAGEYTVSTIKNTVVSMAGFFTGGVDDFAASVVEGSSDEGPTVGSSSGNGGSRPASEGDENRLVSIYGVARIGASASEDGMSGFVLLMAFVNVSIGVLNLIPLLPLDGGHAAVATYERIRSIGGRRHMADVSRLLPLTYAVVMFLVLIGVSSIYLDIVDPIGLG